MGIEQEEEKEEVREDSKEEEEMKDGECKMNDDRLVTIETKIAFLENVINDLSDTVYNQQKQIDTLNKTLKYVINQIRNSSLISPGGTLKNEKPPHY